MSIITYTKYRRYKVSYIFPILVLFGGDVVDQLRAAVQDDEEKRDHILPIGKDGVSSVQLLRHEAWRQYLHPHPQPPVQAAKLPRGRGHGVH